MVIQWVVYFYYKKIAFSKQSAIPTSLLRNRCAFENFQSALVSHVHQKQNKTHKKRQPPRPPIRASSLNSHHPKTYCCPIHPSSSFHLHATTVVLVHVSLRPLAITMVSVVAVPEVPSGTYEQRRRSAPATNSLRLSSSWCC